MSNVLKCLCLRFRLTHDCQLEKVVERCSYNLTGADFYALCSDAMLNAIARTIACIDSGYPNAVLHIYQNVWCTAVRVVLWCSVGIKKNSLTDRKMFKCIWWICRKTSISTSIERYFLQNVYFSMGLPSYSNPPSKQYDVALWLLRQQNRSNLHQTAVTDSNLEHLWIAARFTDMSSPQQHAVVSQCLSIMSVFVDRKATAGIDRWQRRGCCQGWCCGQWRRLLQCAVSSRAITLSGWDQEIWQSPGHVFTPSSWQSAAAAAAARNILTFLEVR